jgi:hypothetical protein
VCPASGQAASALLQIREKLRPQGSRPRVWSETGTAVNDVEHGRKEHGPARKPVRGHPGCTRLPARAARRAVAWFLLLCLPVHGLTVVYLSFWGPSHFHLQDEDHDHPHAHGPGHVDRHHHPAADASVVTVEADAALDAHALEDGALPAWSGAVFPAMVSIALSPSPARTGNGIEPVPDAPVKTRFLGRLERPPRLALA